MDKYSLYIHTNKKNGKRYVGITKREPPESRWGTNGNNYRESPHLYSAIQKYGWDNFDHELIHSGMTRDDACLLEKHFISFYKTQNRDYGYNVFEGGTAPSVPEEVRQKMSKSMMGNKNCLGRVTSEETKRKISGSQKGRPLTEEHRKALCKPKSVTYPCSEERRQRIIAAKKDKKSVICIETGVIYPSIHECARQMNIPATSICAVLNGRHNSTSGYHFKYNDI